MEKLSGEGNKKKYLTFFILLWIVQMAAAVWFCTQKQGFHEDEFYTFYSTARTNGFFVEDGKWVSRESLRNEFVVLPGEEFQYGLVRTVQSWDVHPPMYYWVFHTVASLFPGVFSKWIGLSVNLFFHGIVLLLLAWLTYLVSEKDEKMVLLVNFVYGFTPAALSGVVFIRMYVMLTAFVLLCVILHVRVVRAAGDADGRPSLLSGTTLLAMAAVTYFGFLTQYYYFIFLFFLAGAFGLWLLRKDRGIGNCLRYALAQGLAFCLAYLTYPVFPAQMFRGSRGAQAVDNFFNLKNTMSRIWFFLDLMNGYVFGYLFFGILLVMAFLAAAARGRQKDASPGAPYFILLTAAAGYFLVVSKTGLLLSETSNRYQLPIYGIVILLTFLGMRALWRRQFSDCSPFRPIGMLCVKLVSPAVRHRRGTERAAILLAMGLVVMAHLRTDVVFLYPEAAERLAFARERAETDAAAVYFYQPGEEWCVWAVADELMVYPEVYFAAAGSVEPIADDRIENAHALTVYAAEDVDVEEQFGRLGGKGGIPEQNELQLVFEEKFCDVYRWR